MERITGVRAYNLGKTTDVTIGGKPVSVFKLGEEGRGREQKIVRCDPSIADGDLVTLTVPKKGMPGSISISKVEPGSIASDSAKLAGNTNCWLVRISTQGAYIRGAKGNVRWRLEWSGHDTMGSDLPEAANTSNFPTSLDCTVAQSELTQCGVSSVSLVAKGFGAFGDAGRTGTWDDVLILVRIISQPIILRVKPSRGEPYFLKVTQNEIVRYGNSKEANFDGIATEIELFKTFLDD